jgi:pimeloyl-ACP methyl ester carboxylesterase
MISKNLGDLSPLYLPHAQTPVLLPQHITTLGGPMPFADLAGHRVFYEDTGGDKPVLAFSHGLLMDHAMFAPQIEALRADWRCVSWDERGHGLTGQIPNLSPFTYWDSAKDLAALLAHLGIDRAILVGMSQGGFLSLRCALLYPSLVRALIMIDTQAGPEEPTQMVGNRAVGEFWLENGPTESLLDNAERVLLGEHWPGAPAWREKWWHFSPRHFLECLNTLGEREDLTPRLAEIQVPALVIHGDADLAIPVSKAEALAEGLRARLEVVPGAGHAANLTHPEPVNAAIETFLRLLPE